MLVILSTSAAKRLYDRLGGDIELYKESMKPVVTENIEKCNVQTFV